VLEIDRVFATRSVAIDASKSDDASVPVAAFDSSTSRYAFELPDAQGRIFSLDSRRSTGPTIVIFFRGHWCPYCRRYLSKVQAHLPRLRQVCDVTVVAISNEPAHTSAALAKELELTFPILCDATGATVDQFGVRNGFRAAASLVHPSIFIFDDQLRLQFMSIDRNYKARTTMRTLLKELEAIATTPVAR